MRPEIKTYQLFQLNELISTDYYESLKNIPITKHRALSYVNNPRAIKNDVVLITASVNEELIGYRLMLPDEVRIGNNSERFVWLSGIWVLPSARGTGIAKLLMEEAQKHWQDAFMFQGAVKESKALYEGSKLFNSQILEGFKGYSLFSLKEILSNKKSSNWKISIGRFCDFMGNGLAKLRLKVLLRKYKKATSYFRFNEVSDVNELLESNQMESLFKRGTEEYKWILNFPWIIQTEINDDIPKRFHFSSITPEYRLTPFEILHSDGTKSLLIIKVINGNAVVVKSILSKTNELDAVSLINYFTSFNQWKSVVVFDETLKLLMQNESKAFFYKRTIEREYHYSKRFEKYFKENSKLKFSYEDGDTIFT